MSNMNETITAYLYSATEPDKVQYDGLHKFITEKYGADIELKWVQSDKYEGGFGLEIGEELYDWSIKGRLRQLKNAVAGVASSNEKTS